MPGRGPGNQSRERTAEAIVTLPQWTVVTLHSQLAHGDGARHGGQTTQNGERRFIVLCGQLALRGRVCGVDPHRASRQFTLVRHQDALVGLNVEDLRGGERQRVAGNVRVHLAGQIEIGWRSTVPHLGRPALVQSVNDALDAGTDPADNCVSAVGEVRKSVSEAPCPGCSPSAYWTSSRTERERGVPRRHSEGTWKRVGPTLKEFSNGVGPPRASWPSGGTGTLRGSFLCSEERGNRFGAQAGLLLAVGPW